MKELLKKVFPRTIPVMTGYLALGFAFGVLLQEKGYGVLWAFVMSTFIYAGSGQFLAVTLLSTGDSLLQVALLTFLLNFRHIFYGLSFLDKYKGIGKRKAYLIFGLTDETYALLTGYDAPEGIKDADYYLMVTLLNHIYWIIGGVLGAFIGGLIPFELKGIDFVMTALFAVLVVEQWKTNKSHIPALIGFALTITSLLIFGADNFLIPALIVMSCLLLCLQKVIKVDKEEEKDGL
ncbi:MAG: AzlC family ABC transporter permease [Bacilli bacterium]